MKNPKEQVKDRPEIHTSEQGGKFIRSDEAVRTRLFGQQLHKLKEFVSKRPKITRLVNG